ncbi:arabinan endo-1,5-alpha-L-arabinosidase [Deinococcus metalli]|uniref:Arabinan endo-1,5-alpha-L-arabinosidase n=1 Tax=Deinococcus metalli TaxID=1141878 RepID=A0A7W8KIN1_9DEIO|nr:arabinan endo-1,5-alpha-L-arabinosidase [Deinococcus metalli]MBB5377701.1 arabinan endo-1,5-alpha-L-arabinosidase [Deinococcus metalli]GHF52671.1 arabinan endo-1,5-alpha-L-arabinosidase [Deinococcus metalli]
MRARMLMAALLTSAALAGGGGPPVQPALKGNTQLHDPTLLKVGSRYVAMGTGLENVDGGTLRLRTSPDGVTWTDAGTLGVSIPEWIYDQIGTQPPNLWAPTLSTHGGVTYLYYAASVFGENTSVIGLYTNAKLDPAHPERGWVDRGPVLTTKKSDSFNAIDPYRLDAPDGRAWMVFGSYWTGIKLRELDPVSGKLKGTRQYDLASRGGGAVEAATLVQHGRYFYLFVSFDRCCAGVDSTYRIMVGRSTAITGPYVDREGVPMMQGGGTQVQASKGRYIGPGGQEVYTDGAEQRLVYHYYDGNENGVSHFQTARLNWDADGWPDLGALPNGGN